jgi:hypothetical protein
LFLQEQLKDIIIVFRAFALLAVFVLVNHHFPVVLGESTCRKWSEITKCKTWSGSKLGRAGDGARELSPLDGVPRHAEEP